ncbi:MAG: hypothetical protein QOD66_1389 [Solirubrobacteraceae bacterium]|jgi:hypothetical protein|nr:hypothetical protein [Solirubrobacteraceae bacterium]
MPLPEPAGLDGRTPVEIHLEHAEFHRREDGIGIGVAVVRSSFERGAHVWDCVASDGREWHYIRVLSEELGPFPNVSAEEVERGVGQFAANLPERYRIRHLLNANPLHIDGTGAVAD